MTATLHSVHRSTPARGGGGREPLVIALVNNMPDAALQTTEAQFGELLRVAGEGVEIRLRLFSFPELIRSESGRAYVAERYEPIDQLWGGEFDGLIVTGAEPRTARLSDEVYWPSLVRLADAAVEIGTPAIWSCLAAHAAVLHLNGVERRRLGEKISGVFNCAKVHEHALTSGLPTSWAIPHSRHNTLDANALEAAGYEILSHSAEAGADTFLLPSAMFVFYQGHPEYDPGALYREYRRDVGRFLSGTMDSYPEMPRGYFDAAQARAFTDFRVRAHRQRTRELLADFPIVDMGDTPTHRWRDAAVRLYANWLTILAERAWPASQRVGVDAGAPACRP